MANKKISELDNLAAGSEADTDLIEVARSSTAENFRFSWASIKAALKTYFDTLYTALTTFNSHVSDFNSHVSDFNSHVVDFNSHSARHENGGADEISVAGLSGELADDQPLKEHSNTKHSTNLVGETGVITAMSEKTTPADDDVFVIEDSAALNVVKKLKVSNLPTSDVSWYDIIMFNNF